MCRISFPNYKFNNIDLNPIVVQYVLLNSTWKDNENKRKIGNVRRFCGFDNK